MREEELFQFWSVAMELILLDSHGDGVRCRMNVKKKILKWLTEELENDRGSELKDAVRILDHIQPYYLRNLLIPAAGV